MIQFYLNGENMNSNNQSQNRLEYFQNLGALSGIQELSDGAAAICSGGLEPVTLYDIDFRKDKEDQKGGEARAIYGDTKDLGNFDGKTSSVIVREGKWRLYSMPNFQTYIPGVPLAATRSIDLGPGSYNAGDLQRLGLGNNSLYSIEKIS
jgi:hypothetical protein